MIPLSRFALLSLASSTTALAQEVPQATPSPLPTFIPVPTETPVPQPTASALPLPVSTPTPAPRATASPAARPTPRPTPSPSGTPTPVAIATSSIAAPNPVPTSAAVPIPEPSASAPVPSPTTASVSDRSNSSLWPWLAGAAALALGGALVWRMRRRDDEAEEVVDVVAAPPVPDVPPPPRADLALAFRPTRAGLNMLSATVEGELVVTNTGEAEASDVRVRADLFTAHPGLDADLAARRGEPGGRTVVPPFTLGAGETRALRVVAATTREALMVLTAGDRPMFVPVLGIDILHAGGQLSHAYAVGIERVDSPKLAPFWLDVPPRSYDQVAARPHGAVMAR